MTNEIGRLGGRALAEGSSPSWSPTGDSIVYCRGDELKILDIAYGKSRSFAPSGKSPAWSPGDGRYIAYVRGPEGKEQVCMSEPAGSFRQLLEAGKNPRWSADGRTLYFYSTEKRHECALSVDRGQAAVAVESPGDLLSPGGIASGDGSHIARQNEDRLRVVDRKTGKFAREWPIASTVDDAPVWSRDGRYLAFAGFRCASGVILGVLDVEKNLLLRVGGSQFGFPRWSPDGSQLAFVLRRQGSAEIWSVPLKALQQSQPLAAACVCPAVPQAAAELIGPWHCPLGKLVPIDLSHHYTGDKRGIIAGNTLELAAGKQVLAGVELQIGSRMIQLQGAKFPQMPPFVNSIPVHRRAVRLYILHATQYAVVDSDVRDGECIAEYRIRYADGDLATIPVNVGQDVRDWCDVDHGPVPRSQIAWVGTNQFALTNKRYVRLYLTTWKNPHPEKTLKSIDYVSMKGIAAPFCLAMTMEEPRCVGGEPDKMSGTGRPAEDR